MTALLFVVGTLLAVLILRAALRMIGTARPWLVARIPRRPLVLFVLASFLLGAYVCLDMGSSLLRFGGLEYLPRVIALEVVGSWGHRLAPAAALFAAIVALDREARDSTPAQWAVTFRTHVVRASLASWLGYLLACMLLFAGALTTWSAWFDQSTASFVRDARETLGWKDTAWGVGWAGVLAVLVAATLLGGRKFWTGTRSSLGRKLVVAGALMLVVYVIEGIIFAG